jgi:hypothetical protein
LLNTSKIKPLCEHSFVLGVGQLHIELRGHRPVDEIGFGGSLQPFVVDESPNMTIEIAFGPIDADVLGGAHRVFDSEGLWQLYETDQQLLISLRTVEEGRSYRLAIFDRQLSRGRIVSDPAGRSGAPGALLPDPLEYPLAEVLMILLLAKHGGLMVHACGLERDGQGYLFVGPSGQGKTTIARLAKGRYNVLNDDRVVLRMKDGRPWMFGTPWHGELSQVSPAGVPLQRLFFIEQADRHSAAPVRPAAASAALLSRAFPPLWSSESMAATLAFVDDVVACLQCYRLDFRPEPGLFEEVERCG